MYKPTYNAFDSWNDSSHLYVSDTGFTELDLQRRWNRLVFPLRLSAITGEQILVIDGGTLNQNAGPDFLNGVMMVGGQVLHGDIELHLNEEGWHDHGHCRDTRYKNVILHLFRSATGRNEICQHAGYTPSYAAEISGLAEKKKRGGSQQSRRCAEQSIVPESARVLETLGWRRLIRKSQQMNRGSRAADVETVWYSRMLQGMGYGQNIAQMMRVAHHIPYSLAGELSLHLAEQDLVDFVLGFTGFAEEYDLPVPVWDELSATLQITGFRATDWKPMRSRPSNHPVIRLSLLFRNLCQWAALLHSSPLVMSPGEFIDALTASMAEHSGERKFFPGISFALGKSRAAELVINVYIPLWLHLMNSESATGLFRWASNLPAIPVYHHLQQFLANSRWNDIYNSGYMKPLQIQGLLWLQQQYCQRNFCKVCPVLS